MTVCYKNKLAISRRTKLWSSDKSLQKKYWSALCEATAARIFMCPGTRYMTPEVLLDALVLMSVTRKCYEPLCAVVEIAHDHRQPQTALPNVAKPLSIYKISSCS